METWDAIRARRNVRDYEDRAIPDATLDQILEAAWRTPSSRNRQRWDLVVLTDRPQLTRLSEVKQGAGHVARAAAAIALIGPVEDDPQVMESIQYDLGQLTMSTMLAAADLGVASGHSSVRDQDVARAVLGLPDDRFCDWIITLGYPADRPLRPIQSPDRRAFEEVVHRGSW